MIRKPALLASPKCSPAGLRDKGRSAQGHLRPPGRRSFLSEDFAISALLNPNRSNSFYNEPSAGLELVQREIERSDVSVWLRNRRSLPRG